MNKQVIIESLAPGLSLDVTFDGTQDVNVQNFPTNQAAKLTSDGTNFAVVKNTSPLDPATEYGLVTRSIPSDSLMTKLDTIITLLQDIKSNTLPI